MMPDWLPVKLMASSPSSRIAIDRSAMAIRSPADSNMSSSRRSGLAETCFARARSSSVVSPMADTTTTTSWPLRLVLTTRSATCRMRATSATLEPPYFCTTIATVELSFDHRLSTTDFRLIKGCHYRRMIARADVLLYRTRDEALGDEGARQDVIQAPADISLAHVPPRRPPGEQIVIVGVDGAADIDESPRDDALEKGALFGQLSDRSRLALFRMNVAVRAGDVEVAAEDDRLARRFQLGRERRERFEKAHLCREVF